MSSANSRRSIWATRICQASFRATRRMLQSFEGCWVKIKEQRHKLAGTLLESNVPFFFSCRWACTQSKLRLNNGCSDLRSGFCIYRVNVRLKSELRNSTVQGTRTLKRNLP